MGKGLFLYFLHDEYTRLFRKMLTLEQFHDSELSDLYTKQYLDDPLKYQSGLFSLLIEKGKIKSGNSEVMALQFYAPIYTLLTVCDRQPDREDEALKMIEKHIRQFNHNYMKEVEE